VTEDLISAVEEVVVDIIGEVLVQMNTNTQNMNTTSTNNTMNTNSQQQQQQNGKQTRTMIEDDAQEDNNNKDNDNEELPYGEEIEEDNDDDNATAKTVAELVSLMKNTTSAHLLSARALIKTPYVELYVPHCIFSEGITRAEKKLQQQQTSTSTSTIPIVWRNTNTRPSEYVIALEAAQQAHRPVKFIWWGMKMNRERNDDNDAHHDCDSMDNAVLVDIMPTVSRKELLKRNIQHFRHTGRYIPAGAIGGSLDRIENLLHTADKIATKAAAKIVTTSTTTNTTSDSSSNTASSSSVKGIADDDNYDDDQKLQEQQQQQLVHMNKMMDRAFAYLGGFHINTETGLVTKVSDCKQLRQPFSYRTSSSSRSTKPIKRKKKQKQYTENRGKVK